jgi:hypothetical protein
MARSTTYRILLICLLNSLSQSRRSRLAGFLYGSESKRIRDHELIMRILALFSDGEEYARPLKTFLNKFAQATVI